MSQRKKNIALLISLSGLSLLSLILFLASGNNTEAIDPTRFHLTDSKAVNKVVFMRDTAKVVLEFRDGRWLVNDTYPADRGLVDVLFATMERAVPKRAAALRVRDSVVRQTKQLGIKTEFYIDGNTDRVLRVWGDEQAGVTYFLDDQQDIPYVMTIPGYRVFVGGIFAQEANTWRDKRIFNFNWRNFTALKAMFPNDPAQNFKASMAERFFSIDGLANIDTTALNNYLDAVSLIEGDEFYKVGTSSRFDSLITTKPIMIISVTEVSGRDHTLELYGVGRSELRILARWGNDYIWFDRRNILQIYKKRKDFIKQPG